MGIGGLLRRMGILWVVAASAFVILVTAGAYVALPTPYQSQAELALTAPTTGNPYSTFNNALDSDVDLLSRSLNSQASAEQLQALGVSSGSFASTFPANALGPWLQLTVTGSDAAQVSRSIQIAITYTEQHWRAMQQGVSAPADSMIALSLIAPPNSPTSTAKRKLEEVIGAAVVATGFAILLLAFVDGVIRRRRTKVQRLVSPLPDRSPLTDRLPQTAQTDRSPQAAPTERSPQAARTERSPQSAPTR